MSVSSHTHTSRFNFIVKLKRKGHCQGSSKEDSNFWNERWLKLDLNWRKGLEIGGSKGLWLERHERDRGKFWVSRKTENCNWVSVVYKRLTSWSTQGVCVYPLAQKEDPGVYLHNGGRYHPIILYIMRTELNLYWCAYICAIFESQAGSHIGTSARGHY